MGSCYSTSTYLGTGKRSVTDTVTVTGEVGVLQSWKSGRWKRKKSGGDVTYGGVGGGGCNNEIEIISGSGSGSGKIFINGSSSSKLACLYTQQGKKGVNQDAMVVWENFSSRSDTVFCGVFDGHGPYGHMVAKKVRDALPVILCTQWKANSNADQSNIYNAENAHGSPNFSETASPSIDDEWFKSLEIEQNEKLPEMYLPLKRSFLKAFKLMDKELKFHPTIDCFCSGTTAVTVVKQGQDLVIGNVGDSRAVLATRDKDNCLIAVQLTVDLKPDLPGEAARIQQCKGRVFALQDEPEVARVWLPNNDSPGLAMARAFGDFCLKDFGLISIPDVYHHHITERDEFIILATDGVWDVLSNKEAADVVASAPGRTTAARALVDCASRSWRLKYPTSKNDDCAAVCLFFNHQSVIDADVMETSRNTTNEEAKERMEMTNDNANCLEINDSHTSVPKHSDSTQGSDEIVPVPEPIKEKLLVKGQSRRSLAEFISTADDDEWSALEGITRVNSLLSIPRFLSGDKGSASRRKWL
ncbi:probable protein phosphatase 2C 6 isoform X1 [Ziziphus jujuba]|uniref:Probable protein phosphatase 2C 6 isoform X1 n=1 Tax=Ziziphus jujuba TaxID=326968 RepID=A0A6P3ZPP9_ZIZJJ|nr:probable protein phosphatase 2C 6 isoform X1 [Ziziphus jujuba]